MEAGILALIVCLLVSALPVHAQNDITVNITWTAPTTNLDGSPLTDLAGYRLYWGATIDTLNNQEEIADKDALSYQFTLPSGMWIFVLAAIDSQGNISPPSQGAVLNASRPSAPTGVGCTGTYALIPGTQMSVACVPTSP